MWFSSKTFVVAILAIFLHNDPAVATIDPVKDNLHVSFIVFVGVQISQYKPEGVEFVREVVGIGAIIGNKYVITTQEYMRWYLVESVEYFVYAGSHDFDSGGQEVKIKEVKIPPENVKTAPTSLALLVLQRNVVDIPGTSVIPLDGQFLKPSEKVTMIGIYQNEHIKIGISNETVMANKECAAKLNINTESDKSFKGFGSHMCLMAKNWVRVDCKSHIATIVVVRVLEGSYVNAIKSELHQSCSNVPYIVKFQRVAPMSAWFEDNMI